MSIPQYFAEIDNNNVVINVHVVTQQFLDDNPDRYPGTYVETFINVPGKTYAGVGYTYDSKTKDFIPPIYIPQPPIEA
jgi:hypothetical protein